MSGTRIEEEEKSIVQDNSLMRTRESQYQGTLKNQLGQSIQNINQLNLIQLNEIPGVSQLSYQSQWWNQLSCGYVSMPLGTDNLYIPLNDSNIGSIISFVLSSNIYKEAMIK